MIFFLSTLKMALVKVNHRMWQDTTQNHMGLACLRSRQYCEQDKFVGEGGLVQVVGLLCCSYYNWLVCVMWLELAEVFLRGQGGCYGSLRRHTLKKAATQHFALVCHAVHGTHSRSAAYHANCSGTHRCHEG